MSRSLEENIKNKFLIDKVLETIKKSYRDKKRPTLKDKISTLIPLFVLDVGRLEFWIKWLNVKDLKNLRKKEEYLKRATLGRAIDDFERCAKFKDSKHFRVQKLLTEKYICSFIVACRKVNELRNNLYHNLYSKSKDLKSLLRKIKPRIELSSNTNYDIHHTIKRKILKATHHRSLSLGKKLPSYWTIDMLFHILYKYYLPNKL